MNESWHIWMSHGTYEWVMAYTNESWHIWMSHGTYEWVMAHMNESLHIWMFRDTYGWVTARMNESWHTWMSHWRKGSSMCNIVMSFHESCQMNLLVTNFVSRTKFVIHTQNSWLVGKKESGCRDFFFQDMSNESMNHGTYDWFVAYICVSHVTHKLVTSHIWISHVYESWHTLLSHVYKRFICAGVGMSWGKNRDNLIPFLQTQFVIAQSFVAWYRVAKTHRIPYLYSSFSARMTYI